MPQIVNHDIIRRAGYCTQTPGLGDVMKIAIIDADSIIHNSRVQIFLVYYNLIQLLEQIQRR